MVYEYSVEIDKYSATSLVDCLKNLEKEIPDFDEWRFIINGGGIDYGIYLNFNLRDKEIEICNQPRGEGNDYLDDVIDALSEDEE